MPAPEPTTAAPSYRRGELRVLATLGRLRGEAVSVFGALRLNRLSTLRRAIRAFGRPVSRRKIWGGSGCVVRWRDAGVRAVFANFGAPPTRRGACDRRFGLLQEATAADSDWWTSRGLRLGDSRDDVIGLYPAAEYHRGAWWLAQTFLPYGDGGYVPTLAAIMRDGLVDGFYVYVGAAGD